MKQVASNVISWRKKGKHLPRFMRDFHDQKDLFKTMHDLTIQEENKISWIDGHIYVIDMFLWFMARFGYTLQKTKTRLDFEGIEETIKSNIEHRAELFLNQ